MSFGSMEEIASPDRKAGPRSRPGSGAAVAPWLGLRESDSFVAYAAFFERNASTASSMPFP